MAKKVKTGVDVYYVLPGRPRSKKNGKRIFGRGRKKILLSSEEYLEWEEVALIAASGQCKHYEISQPVLAVVTVWQAKGQSIDITNSIEGAWDVLEKTGVLKNDYLISNTYIERLRDQENPRIEIRLIDLAAFKKSKIAHMIAAGEWT